MGSVVVACYKPKPGKEAELMELVYNHAPNLRAEGLITDREPIIMKCADGTVVEVFEWVSQEALAGAHTNSAVQAIWKDFEAACTYATPASLPEFQNVFGHFQSA